MNCEHVTEKRLKRFSNGSLQIALQCVKCGVRVGNWLPQIQHPGWESFHPFDEEAEQRYRTARGEEFRETFKSKREAEDRAWLEEYERYLASPQWKRMRLRVLVDRRGICQGCGKDLIATSSSFPPSFQVHHVHELGAYRVPFGSELLFQLVLLCPPCHDRFPSKFEALSA